MRYGIKQHEGTLESYRTAIPRKEWESVYSIVKLSSIDKERVLKLEDLIINENDYGIVDEASLMIREFRDEYFSSLGIKGNFDDKSFGENFPDFIYCIANGLAGYHKSTYPNKEPGIENSINHTTFRRYNWFGHRGMVTRPNFKIDFSSETPIYVEHPLETGEYLKLVHDFFTALRGSGKS